MPYKDVEVRLKYGRAYHKKWYLRNKSKVIADKNSRLREMRDWLDELKQTLKCERCRETDIRCLDFNHKDRRRKRMGIAEMVHRGYSKENILAEIKKCNVLCANCHRRETFNS